MQASRSVITAENAESAFPLKLCALRVLCSCFSTQSIELVPAAFSTAALIAASSFITSL